MYGRGSHDKLTDSGDWREHIVLTQHRYMLEDVRIGLSFLVSVGELAGVPTPLARAFLSIGGAICGEDFMQTGRTLAVARPRRPRSRRAAGAARRGPAMSEPIACLGAGRMGRGIAVVFAYAGHQVVAGRLQAARRCGVREAVRRGARRSAQRARHARELRPVRSRRHVDAHRGARLGRARSGRAGRALVRRHHLRRRAGSARPQARGAGARLAARRADADHRLDHLDHPGRRSFERGRAPRALPQRALAQSGLSGAAGRNLARRSTPIRPSPRA